MLLVPWLSPVETRRHVFAEGQPRIALDRYVVAVIDPAEIRNLEMARQGGSFAADSFHHVTVTAEGVDVVIEDGKTRPIEVARQPARRNRHPDAVPAALAEGTGRGLDARCQVILGMA